MKYMKKQIISRNFNILVIEAIIFIKSITYLFYVSIAYKTTRHITLIDNCVLLIHNYNIQTQHY